MSDQFENKVSILKQRSFQRVVLILVLTVVLGVGFFISYTLFNKYNEERTSPNFTQLQNTTQPSDGGGDFPVTYDVEYIISDQTSSNTAVTGLYFTSCPEVQRCVREDKKSLTYEDDRMSITFQFQAPLEGTMDATYLEINLDEASIDLEDQYDGRQIIYSCETLAEDITFSKFENERLSGSILIQDDFTIRINFDLSIPEDIDTGQEDQGDGIDIANYPTDLPMHPNATVVQYSGDSWLGEFFIEKTVSLAGISFNSVVDFYETDLKANGWQTQVQSVITDEDAEILARKENRQIQVNIGFEDDFAEVTIDGEEL